MALRYWFTIYYRSGKMTGRNVTKVQSTSTEQAFLKFKRLYPYSELLSIKKSSSGTGRPGY